MGKVKAMYQEKQEELESQTESLENDREKLKEAYVLLSSVSKSKIVQGQNLDLAISFVDKIIKECDIAIDINYGELDDNPLTTI